MDGLVNARGGEGSMAEPGADRTLDAYNAIAPVYGEYSKGREAYLQAVEGLVIGELRAGMRLLDVGAGDGRRLEKIRNAVGIADFVAVEPSPGMARICRERTGAPVHEAFAEDLDRLDLGSFDAITALWNVFGHISAGARPKALRNLAAKLRPGGRILLDVNNRHNAAAYGRFAVLKRVLIDALAFDPRRGDAVYEWKIGGQAFRSSGHLFTPGEIEDLIGGAGLKVRRRIAVDYATGAVSESRFRGQLFYVLGA
jgi:SAM-dependent methyltransferase